VPPPETVGSFALTRQVTATFEVAPEARHIVVVAPAPVFVGVLGSELREGDTTIGRGDLRRLFDVLTELGVYLVGVNPRGNNALASGEGDTTDVFTSDFPVLMVGTRSASLTSVHTVLSVLVLSDDSVNVAAFRENGHILGERPHVALFEVVTLMPLGGRSLHWSSLPKTHCLPVFSRRAFTEIAPQRQCVYYILRSIILLFLGINKTFKITLMN